MSVQSLTCVLAVFTDAHRSTPHTQKTSLPDSLNLDVLLVDDPKKVKPVKAVRGGGRGGGRGGRGGLRGRGGGFRGRGRGM